MSWRNSDLVNNKEKRLLQYTFLDSKILSCYDLCPFYLPVIQTVNSIDKVAELCKHYSREFEESNLTSRRMEAEKDFKDAVAEDVVVVDALSEMSDMYVSMVSAITSRARAPR